MAETETITVTVNYGLRVEEAVRNGRYNWSNNNINSRNFATARSGEHQLRAILVNFNYVISPGYELRELDKMGLRAGELHELLAVGAQHPNIQRAFPIIVLGSLWWMNSYGYWTLPYLDDRSGGRVLDLEWYDNDWDGYCRFLAFPK